MKKLGLLLASVGVCALGMEPPKRVSFTKCGNPTRSHEVCLVHSADSGRTYLYLKVAQSPLPPVFARATELRTPEGTWYEGYGIELAADPRRSSEKKLQLFVTEENGRTMGRFVSGWGNGMRFELR